jgi:hypothetical protein
MGRYAIVEVPGAFVVVDTSIPGGRDLERHAERARAEAVLARLQAEGDGAQAGAASPAGLDPATLKAGEVVKAAGEMSDAVALKALHDAEAGGAARATVLAAIVKRLEGLGAA